MLVFVDESGDAGMNLEKGSSAFFVVTAVVFDDHGAADACDIAINEIRTSLRMPATMEFRFSKNSEQIRVGFLQAVRKHDFMYVAIILNKAKLFGPGFQFPDSLIKYTVKLAFQNARPYLSNAIVVIDGNGERKFRNQMRSYLKRQINEKDGPQIIKKVKLGKSCGNNLIQLADMVSGALWHTHRHQDDSYRRIIGARELSVQVWPK